MMSISIVHDSINLNAPCAEAGYFFSKKINRLKKIKIECLFFVGFNNSFLKTVDDMPVTICLHLKNTESQSEVKKNCGLAWRMQTLNSEMYLSRHFIDRRSDWA